MTYNVFGGTLNLTQSIILVYAWTDRQTNRQTHTNSTKTIPDSHIIVSSAQKMNTYIMKIRTAKISNTQTYG